MTSPKSIHKQVYIIFHLFFLVYYVFPFFMHLLYQEEYESLFTNMDQYWPIVYVIIFFFSVKLLNLLLHTNKRLPLKKIGFVFENKKINLFVFGVFLLVCIKFSLNYTMHFRHSSSNTISGAGYYVMIMFALRSYVKVYFLFLILKYGNHLKITKWQRILAGIGVLGFLISIISSLDILWAIFGVLVFLKKEKLLFSNFRNIWVKIRSHSKKIVLLFLFVLAVIYIGNANKVGSEKALNSLLNVDKIEYTFIHTAKRLSVWYVSVITLGVEQNLLDNERAFTALNGIFSNINSRFSILLGKNVDRGENWSVKRMNYKQVFLPQFTHDSDTGSSPGLVASFFYLPFFPLNFLVIVIYTVFILRYFSKGFNFIKEKFNFFALILLIFYIISALDSPIDLINFIDPSFIFVFFLLSSMDQIENLNRRRLLKNAKRNNQKNACDIIGIK